MEREGTAFIGFTYNGKHSIDDFGIYRTSDGNRYNYNLIPQLNDKTVDIPGGHGQYYFNSTYKTRQFSIPIAFDKLQEDKFYKMELQDLNKLKFSFNPYNLNRLSILAGAEAMKDRQYFEET